MSSFDRWSRRTVLQSTAYAAALGLPQLLRAAIGNGTPPNAAQSDGARAKGTQPNASGLPATLAVEPFPLDAVRLTPSAFLTAVESNGRYLSRLEPDRLLHNFRVSAKLTPMGEVYGGWESESLAGHTLGHYLSACSLMFAQTRDGQYRQRVDYIVSELLECQQAHGDGYVGGFTRKQGDVVEDGKRIFPEISQGDIRSKPFSLNGAWSPLYTLHKLFAGLLDANEHCHSPLALKVAEGLGHYLERAFSSLSEEQMQQVLACEYGGLNESFAQLYQRTSEQRWLLLARRIYDHKILDPLSRELDELEDVHSNTQVPKVVGLARLHEVTGDAGYGTAARFFWLTVTRNRSYVIGGNADRESFQSPLSEYVTEQTCEACNTYNMLKLTRHLYQWTADATYFDYYERAHLNHILAQHHPDTGMFAYMMPLMSGARREFSKPFDDFWCCMGTGMESHSKHGDSIYWKRGDELLINLYVPSELSWPEQDTTVVLRSGYPYGGLVTVQMTGLVQPRTYAVSLRIPGWCKSFDVRLNGSAIEAQRQGGYVTLRRSWVAGDKIELQLAMRLRAEPTRDDHNLIALLYGPMVMAADLGSANDRFEDAAPVLVGKSSAEIVTGIGTAMNTRASSQPPNLTLKPFFAQYDRRSAVYFPRLSEQQWQIAQAAAMARKARLGVLEAQTIDVMRFGDPQSERDHELRAEKSEAVLYRARNGRLARGGTFFEFRLRTTRSSSPGPSERASGPAATVPSPSPALVLQVIYWGRQRNSRFHILAQGTRVASVSMDGSGPVAFIERSYALPAELTRGKEFVVFRFEPEEDAGAGPVFECRLLPEPTAAA